MTLEDAIKHCEDKACGTSLCNKEHKQLAKWLKELKQYRKRLHYVQKTNR